VAGAASNIPIRRFKLVYVTLAPLFPQELCCHSKTAGTAVLGAADWSHDYDYDSEYRYEGQPIPLSTG